MIVVITPSAKPNTPTLSVDLQVGAENLIGDL